MTDLNLKRAKEIVKDYETFKVPKDLVEADYKGVREYYLLAKGFLQGCIQGQRAMQKRSAEIADRNMRACEDHRHEYDVAETIRNKILSLKPEGEE